MFNITVFENFSKKQNSTKVPTNGTLVEVSLKEPTSISNPTFLVKGFNNANITEILWSGTYYFVQDKTIVTNVLCELSCRIDLLATYKSVILATTQYVEYSSSNYDIDILDTRIGSHITPSINIAYGKSNVLPNNTPILVLNVSSKNVNQNTGMGTWYVSASTLSSVIDKVTVDLSSIDELQDLFKSFFSGASIQNILKVTWLPFYPVSLGSSNIIVGNLDTGISAYFPTSNMVEVEQSITIPWKGSNYLRSNLYNALSLYLPFVGNIGLNVQEYIHASAINIKYTIDIVDGSCLVEISGNDGSGLRSFTCKMGVDVPISATSINPVQSAFSLGSSISSGNGSGVVNSLQSMFIPSTDVLGFFQSRATDLAYKEDKPALILEHYAPITTPQSIAINQGGACFKEVTLSTLSGYVSTRNASINIDGYANRSREICNMLDNGVYIE